MDGWLIMLRLLRIILFVLIAAPVAAVVLLVAVTVLGRPDHDHAHPDYGNFAGRFAEVRRAFAAGERGAEIDLAPVNGGAWQLACLFGGYTRPVERMDERGAIVTDADRKRLTSTGGFRAGPVEEFEMLIAFIDDEGRAHFIHFPEGVGSGGQHYQACVTRPQTTVTVSAE